MEYTSTLKNTSASYLHVLYLKFTLHVAPQEKSQLLAWLFRKFHDYPTAYFKRKCYTLYIIILFFFLQTKWFLQDILQTCASVGFFLLSPPSRDIPFTVQSFNLLTVNSLKKWRERRFH